MEDEYELVSKSFLLDLKEENQKLKQENLDLKNNSLKNEEPKLKEKNTQFSEIIFAIQQEAKKEKEEILNQLTQIKSINEKTLNNTLTKAESHDLRFEEMISTMKDLITSLNDILTEVGKSDSNEFKDILIEIKKNLDNENNELKSVELINKQLKDIELFMVNLRTLLSYVKPNDLSLNK